MPSANAVLLPRLLPAELVALGQLVRNPLTPNANTYTKSCAHAGPESTVVGAPEEPFHAVVATDKRGRFEVTLTKLLGAKLHGRDAGLLTIEAEALEYRALRDAPEVFRRACADADTRAWIGDMVLNKAPCYFVIGLQTLRNAVIKRAVLREGDLGGYAGVPLEATAAVPLHVGGELAAGGFGASSAKLSGVFGIEVLKLRNKLDRAGEAVLGVDVSWKWAYQRVKGTQWNDQELSIKLEDVAFEELTELLEQDDKEDEDDEDENEDQR